MKATDIENKTQEITTLFNSLPDEAKDSVLSFISYLCTSPSKTEHNQVPDLYHQEIISS